jgi:Ca2+/Na+ antiporter
MVREFEGSSLPMIEVSTFYQRTCTLASELLHTLIFLVRLIFSYTIPDVNKVEWRPYYLLTMLMSILWLGILAQGILACVEIVGILLGIHPVFLGLTIGAWGASMPTLLSSMIVSKQGLGDMAIANALGANIFSVLVGLGFPWFAYPLYIGSPYEGIRDEGILALLTVLISCIVIYFVLIAWNNYVVKSWMGYVFMLMYLFVIVLCATIFKSDD